MRSRKRSFMRGPRSLDGLAAVASVSRTLVESCEPRVDRKTRKQGLFGSVLGPIRFVHNVGKVSPAEGAEFAEGGRESG
jgi:hypothetical protein